MIDEQQPRWARRARTGAGVALCAAALAVLGACGQKGTIGDGRVVPDPKNPTPPSTAIPAEYQATTTSTTSTTSTTVATTTTSTTSTTTVGAANTNGGSTASTTPGAGGTPTQKPSGSTTP